MRFDHQQKNSVFMREMVNDDIFERIFELKSGQSMRVPFQALIGEDPSLETFVKKLLLTDLPAVGDELTFYSQGMTGPSVVVRVEEIFPDKKEILVVKI